MVSAAPISGTFRVARVRFQKAGQGAILVVEQEGCRSRHGPRSILQVPNQVVAQAPTFHRAQMLEVRGRPHAWRNPQTGGVEMQVRVDEVHEVRPRGSAFIDYVAGKPGFYGIGRVKASKIWDALGERVFEMLASRDVEGIDKAVPGLGAEQADTLVSVWSASGQERLVEWLDQRRLPRRVCSALCRAYRDQHQAVEKIESDPYRLIAFGLTWNVVDDVAAQNFGIGANDPRRLHAAVIHCLMQAYQRGHTAMHGDDLMAAVCERAGLDRHAAGIALRQVYSDGGFVRTASDLFQLRGASIMERAIAADIVERCRAASQLQLDVGGPALLDAFETSKGDGFRLAAKQREAVLAAAALPFSIIVGGAGTGKTACLEALHRLVEHENGHREGIIQMALAGRAAKRMKDATRREAITIAGFLHSMDKERLAKATHIVIDEASMLDVPGIHAVLKRLGGRAKIVLVGDDFQLPPVGSGKVLHVLRDVPGVHVTVLDSIWRQQAGNSILGVATALREGSTVDVPAFDGLGEGVTLLEPDGKVTSSARDLYDRLGGVADPQAACVLSAVKRDATAVNLAIHSSVSSGGRRILGPEGDTGFSSGDRFVCDVNHWDVELMNGSLGIVLREATSQEITREWSGDAEAGDDAGMLPAWAVLVEVDGRERLIEHRHFRDCSWGYALTCHRAQGSDFERVIVVLDDRCDRSWLYTAVTRGRSQVVLVGTREQLTKIARTPPRVADRVVGLHHMLSGSENAHG